MPTSPAVRYTLWSRNRLLGETDLGFLHRRDNIRVGWLHPTPLALELRAIDGAVIPTDGVAIVDTHYLLEISDRHDEMDDVELDAESQAEVDAMIDEWRAEHAEDQLLENAHTEPDTQEEELPRYQIQVYLRARLPDHDW